MSKPLSPDLKLAKKFLQCIDPNSDQHTFQTFDDNADRKDRTLNRIFNGAIGDYFDQLVELNLRGAGIYFTVQGTDGTGRKKHNITRVRAIFQEDDGDGHPLPITPSIVVESSPGKHHRYFLVDDMPLDKFESIQQRLVKDFGSDPNAADRSRVLRLPGFYHQKVNEKKGEIGTPHMVRIIK